MLGFIGRIMSMGDSILGKIATALTPSGSADPSVQLHWRWSVFVVLIGTLLSGVIGVAWIRGDIPGLSGVALASDITDLDRKRDLLENRLNARQDRLEKKITDRQDVQAENINSVKFLIIKASLQQVLKNRCTAINARNQSALESANHDITDYNDQYHDLKGYDYPELNTPCSVILIGNQSH